MGRVVPLTDSKCKCSEIDLKKKLWIIPAKKMKAKREHIVPLTKEVIIILKEIKKANIDSIYVFVSKTSKIGT